MLQQFICYLVQLTMEISTNPSVADYPRYCFVTNNSWHLLEFFEWLSDSFLLLKMDDQSEDHIESQS